MATGYLKAYQVGESDIVSAYTESQAIRVLTDYCSTGYCEGELDVTEQPFEMELQDEEGNYLQTLGDYMKTVVKAEYLFGWE